MNMLLQKEMQREEGFYTYRDSDACGLCNSSEDKST